MKGEKFIIIYAMTMFILTILSEFNIDYTVVVGPLLIIIFVLIVLFILTLLILKKIKPDIYEKILSIFFEVEVDFDGEKYVEELRNKIIHSPLVIKDKNDEKNTDILELMLENMKEIRDYYVISKKQAKNAFSLAISMCILGFLFMITSIVLFVVLHISLEISLIPAIGGAIAEVIAATSLVVYKTSLQQLNNYYESLHNNERFLSLVNLVSKMSESRQDEAYMNIINIELQNYRK